MVYKIYPFRYAGRVDLGANDRQVIEVNKTGIAMIWGQIVLREKVCAQDRLTHFGDDKIMIVGTIT